MRVKFFKNCKDLKLLSTRNIPNKHEKVNACIQVSSHKYEIFKSHSQYKIDSITTKHVYRMRAIYLHKNCTINFYTA